MTVKKGFTIRKLIISIVILAALGYLAFLCVSVLFPFRHLDLIDKYSKKYSVKPALVLSIIHSESKFRVSAVSIKGASGLMQIVKRTADWAAVEIELENYSYDKIHDPEINIEIGCWYIAKLTEQFGNIQTALAAYNAGSGNVSDWLQQPEFSDDGKTLKAIPFGETKTYLKRINSNLKIYSFLYNLFGANHDK